jgi:uncharacterized protein (DUF302 family)
MSYYYSKILSDQTFENVVEKTTEALKQEGFGVLTEIDLQATLKKKLDVDFHKYKILGACNPGFAYKALLSEDKVGTMLPCNVIIQENDKGLIEVAAVNPIASMQAIKNEALFTIATEVSEKLQRVVNSL